MKIILPFFLFISLIYSKIEIAHGVRALYAEFPHLAFLVIRYDGNNYVFCGGGLINSYTVLTTAHCFYDFDKHEYEDYSSYKIGLGGDSLNKLKLYDIDEIRPHSQFNSTTIDNDIALVILKEEIIETNGQRYMDLETSEIPMGLHLWATGFGLLETGALPTHLHKTFIPNVDLSKCEFDDVIPTKNISLCVGNGKEDTCAGDSGGSLVRIESLNDKRFLSVGLVSYGPDTKCGTRGNYGVYVKVSHYVDWIWNYSKGGVPDEPGDEIGVLEYIIDKLNNSRYCFGKLNWDKDVCSGVGVCFATDHCDCGWFYYDNQCQSLSPLAILVIILVIIFTILLIATLIILAYTITCLVMNIKEERKKKNSAQLLDHNENTTQQQ